MKENGLLQLYSRHPVLNEIVKCIGEDDSTRGIRLEGLTGSSKAIVLSHVYQNLQGIHFVLIPEKEEAAYFYNDLSALIGEERVFFFPSSFKRSVQYEQTDTASIVLRTEVLNFLAAGKNPGIIVTYPESAMEKVISRDNLKKNTFPVSTGDKLSLDFLEEVLQEYNFERVDFVHEPGQYSIRGSIADVFSFSADLPYRFDFFSSEVDSIRTFNPDDQLSVMTHDKVVIIPNIQDISIEEINSSVIDFLPLSALIWTDDTAIAMEKINSIFLQTARREQSGDINGKSDLALPGDRIINSLGKFRTLEFGRNGVFKTREIFQFNTTPQPVFNKNFGLLAEKLVSNRSEGFRTMIVSENQSQIDRLRDIFAEVNPDARFEPLLINLHGGFSDNDLKISVYTDHQIFDRYHKFKIRGYFSRKESISIKELTGLNPGDYVVHIDHGIGKFGGLEKIEINGRIQEAIKLVYKDNDILYVGIHSLHRISKYKGRDNSEPRIYKLGSGAWQKLKLNTKKKVKDIARDLIRLYAERMTVPGYSFSPDSYLQRELEASFLYEDTPDQLSATLAVKNDMEADHPMDRLICGDVGFGKTEVAVRAAFKSAVDSKQTAVLVPTTILALQHYKTFSSRLKDFPCNVDYISRHRKASDQKRIFRELEEGKIEIIIGTHKLISQDVKFRDLGLLIIDEEQRFGVSVKEKIKKMKLNVDTLTLTATPIPRTLQFSLMGAKDLSIINTPPPNRIPIVTEIHGFNEDIIREGIDYEVARGGQVFFIHNRVENIREIEVMIRRACPKVKTAVVHGKMEGKDIENVMFDFIQGDYDVLVATTIIESGLDIPNANTIFINDAHHFGLSELHQLRGRVGRSNRKAFCYLLSPPLVNLTQEARRRLRTIEEFSDLGSGFNIAMQDLDIRGSGNLLGAEQSGFISDLGFETYQRILNEAMMELRESGQSENTPETASEKEAGKKDTEKIFVTDFQIDTDLEIMFPDEYVSSISERIRLYKELNEIATEEQLAKYENKLTDMFGPVPPPAAALLDIVRLKWTAVRLGFEKLLLKNNLLIAYFVSDPDSPFYKNSLFVRIMNYVNCHQDTMSVKQKETKLSLTIRGVETVKSARDICTKMLHETSVAITGLKKE